ncbi:putative transmembrane emp24 domain-containing protein 10 precursor [Monocercomonoides exilis]|uniref:putative transmembrane emp24 domain-containing protein 10 precursor n=1 Tax=Monocercomonoides exilis TaxID=2049356 RepID=UPI00355AB0F5|nr:putative transmembrane emp24 domain-containing protein 10 precursor [Monocercomonoides exilis]|eukprot:MONOS_162.1-p1 / transcript=MONOS_162.1 / gene=MONOS_162 / organism=Monocercomonoides_exilis_PA203 / gene_product=transmembrane emp24 domain-containing protein 10 precursor / transcript_product=transmembrane emp24 domain-containing protein 10 precursor / location=Mono_scaffold00003:64227-65169(-) / protein_length=205 / sequence_SO=supercontig / SO=protein_coding / is_pseudo=false
MIGFIFCLLVSFSSSIKLEIRYPGKQCIFEELNSGELFVGNFTLIPYGRTVDFNVTDSKHKVIVSRTDLDKGSFAFTAQAYGDYSICFWNNKTEKVDSTIFDVHTIVDLKLRSGASAVTFKGAESGASEIDHVAANVRSMAEVSKAVSSEIAATRERETESAAQSAKTLRTVKRYSVVSIIFIVVVSVWEVFYLKRFFVSQKVA